MILALRGPFVTGANARAPAMCTGTGPGTVLLNMISGTAGGPVRRAGPARGAAAWDVARRRGGDGRGRVGGARTTPACGLPLAFTGL